MDSKPGLVSRNISFSQYFLATDFLAFWPTGCWLGKQSTSRFLWSCFVTMFKAKLKWTTKIIYKRKDIFGLIVSHCITTTKNACFLFQLFLHSILTCMKKEKKPHTHPKRARGVFIHIVMSSRLMTVTTITSFLVYLSLLRADVYLQFIQFPTLTIKSNWLVYTLCLMHLNIIWIIIQNVDLWALNRNKTPWFLSSQQEDRWSGYFTGPHCSWYCALDNTDICS